MSDHLTRREFVRTSLAAAGALAAGVAARPLSANAAERKPKMHIGLVTYMVGAKMDLATLIEVCEKGGMEGVELRSTHKHGVEPHISAEKRKEVRALFEKSRVRCYALGSACEYHSPDPETVRKNIDLTKKFIDLAADLGCWGVKVRPNGLPKGVSEEKTLHQIGASVRECAEYAAGKKVNVFVECHGRDTSRPDRMMRIMKICDHPRACLAWNCNGIDVQDGSIAKYFKMCQRWIKHVHIHTLTEKGYPWKELYALLKAADFTGFTMIETHYKGDDPVGFLKAQRAAFLKLAV